MVFTVLASVCPQLIFCNEYTQAEGQNWHLKHFCCFDCDCILAGETYVMENDKPVCKPCYMKNYAMVRNTFRLFVGADSTLLPVAETQTEQRNSNIFIVL